MHWGVLVEFATIVAVNLVLSGDNGLVIALAVKALPRGVRLRAIAWGAGCAAVCQLAATCFAAELLRLRFLRLVGGFTILWISLKLFRVPAPTRQREEKATALWKAVGFIVFANLTMSMDNILAVAAAARGNLVLLVFGLGTSIPLVVLASGFLADLMEKYPVIVYAGAAILGKVSAELIMSDPLVLRAFAPGALLRFSIEAGAAVAVVAVGLVLQRRSSRALRAAEQVSKSTP